MSATISAGSPSSTTSRSMATPPIFGEAAQALIACNQKLQELGIDGTIKLPRIVVIGDQSTGKSSLIESISTIEVPKASGLCTKCPIAINLAASPDPSVKWRCTVFVEERFVFNEKQKKITSTHPLGPWSLREDIKLTRVSTTEDRTELVKLIDHAQRLVLDPTREKLLESSKPVDQLQTFSPNTIRLDIEAIGWVNLSFVDLPGVIARAGKGLPVYSVDLVESLARQYAQDPNNVILLTLPLNHDNDNSRSYGLVEKEKAHARTIAVFTKVDLASEEQRIACLNQYFNPNNEDEFGYGQHMVMLSNSDENDYFDSEPWSTLSDTVRGKIGVSNLVGRIRNILFRETQRTLPDNLKSIQTRLQTIERELEFIPAPPNATALPWKLREQLLGFDTRAKQLFVHGSSSRNTLQKRMQYFSTQIGKHEPTLKYKSKAEQKEFETAQATLREANDSEINEIEDDDPDVSMVDDTNSVIKPKCLKSYQFTLEEIRTLNRELYQSDVVGEIEPKALDKMNKMGVQYWQAGLDHFIMRLEGLVSQQVQRCIDEDFGLQKHLPLYAKVQECAKTYMDDVLNIQKQILHHKCAAEMTTPFTLDQDSHKQIMRRVLEDRQKTRQEVRLMVANAIQKAEHAGSKRKPKQLEAGSLDADEFEQELVMFAKAAAYYELASKRFVDNCCQDVLTNLIPAFHLGFMNFIVEQLGLDDIENNTESIAELMAEDPEREAHRQRLIRERDNLDAGRQYIANVLRSTDDGASVYFDTDMPDDPFTSSTLNNSTVSTPSKRKQTAVENNLDGSPTKKNKTDTAPGPQRSSPRIRLPNRARSVDVSDDME